MSHALYESLSCCFGKSAACSAHHCAVQAASGYGVDAGVAGFREGAGLS